MSRLPERLTTERLVLRLPELGDVAPLNRAIRDSHAMLKEWMAWAVEPQTLGETRKFCTESRTAWQDEAALNLVIVERATDEIIGGCGYPRIDWPVPGFEIGYWCRIDRVGRGFISEATWALAAHAFKGLAANRVELRMDDRNARSWHVAERLGFTLEGVLRNEARSPDGSLRATRIYGVTALEELASPRSGRS